MQELRLDPGWDERDTFRLVAAPAELRALLIVDLEDGAVPPEVRLKMNGRQALLITAAESYLLRKVEYSNTLLVCDAAPEPRVIEQTQYMYEAVPTRPRVEMLPQLLLPAAVTKDEVEGLVNPPPPSRLRTLEQLRAQVAAHRAAFDTALWDMGAVMTGGYVRVFSPDFVEEALAALVRYLGNVGSAGCDFGAPVAAIELQFEGVYPRQLVAVVLRQFGTVSEESPVDAPTAGPGISLGSTQAPGHAPGRWFQLSAAKAAQVLVGEVLRERDDWKPADALSLLGDRYLPLAGMRLDDLAGFVAPLTNGGLRYLPHHTLSFDPLLRLRGVFDVSMRWTEVHLEAFLAPLEVTGKAWSAFLAKHCREHKIDDAPSEYTLSG